MSEIEVKPFQDFPATFANSLLRRDLLDKIKDIPTGSVLVCSMAGYGKSTLLYQLASQGQHTAVCILSFSDNDLHFFLSHIAAAIHRSVPQSAIGNTDNTDKLFLHICQVAAENRMTIIFDNCQVVTDEQVCKTLQFLMSAAENSFRVVIGSRKTPDFAARFILEGRCQLLRCDDLALSAGEVGELVSRRLDGENRRLANYLHTITGGWAAGVMFCLGGGGGKFFTGELPVWEGIASRDLIKKYIAFEILADLPHSVVQFAQRSSIIESPSVDICDTILETSDSGECLNYLTENGMFLRQCHGEPKSFIWIDIFRRVMLDLLDTGEKTAIAEKTVEYYLRRKMHLKAIGFALEYGKPDLICRALAHCGVSLLEEEQFEILGKCACVLEKSSEEPDAFIYGMLAQYYYAVGDYAKMEYDFNMADSMFGKENTYSIQRSLYRGLLRYETDPPKYLKIINNALFFLSEYNLKFPFLLPREQKLLEEIMSRHSAAGELHDQKPLQVKQFGCFKVLVVEDGYEISWRTKKGSELLAYLISLNGKSVERSHLFDVIWPDEIPNNPVAMLHNMIYNIRKELGVYKLQKLIQYKNKGYSIDMTLVDCDTEIVSRVCSAISCKDIDALVESEVVLSTYWGEYLENITSMWVAERKEYYDKMFVNGSLLLADFYYDNRIYGKALVFLQNAQKIDAYSERIMEKTLNCYSKLGRFDKLRLAYDAFCHMLDCELDIQPTTDLQMTYQRSMQRKV